MKGSHPASFPPLRLTCCALMLATASDALNIAAPAATKSTIIAVRGSTVAGDGGMNRRGIATLQATVGDGDSRNDGGDGGRRKKSMLDGVGEMFHGMFPDGGDGPNESNAPPGAKIPSDLEASLSQFPKAVTDMIKEHSLDMISSSSSLNNIPDILRGFSHKVPDILSSIESIVHGRRNDDGGSNKNHRVHYDSVDQFDSNLGTEIDDALRMANDLASRRGLGTMASSSSTCAPPSATSVRDEDKRDPTLLRENNRAAMPATAASGGGGAADIVRDGDSVGRRWRDEQSPRPSSSLFKENNVALSDLTSLKEGFAIASRGGGKATEPSATTVNEGYANAADVKERSNDVREAAERRPREPPRIKVHKEGSGYLNNPDVKQPRQKHVSVREEKKHPATSLGEEDEGSFWNVKKPTRKRTPLTMYPTAGSSDVEYAVPNVWNAPGQRAGMSTRNEDDIAVDTRREATGRFAQVESGVVAYPPIDERSHAIATNAWRKQVDRDVDVATDAAEAAWMGVDSARNQDYETRSGHNHLENYEQDFGSHEVGYNQNLRDQGRQQAYGNHRRDLYSTARNYPPINARRTREEIAEQSLYSNKRHEDFFGGGMFNGGAENIDGDHLRNRDFAVMKRGSSGKIVISDAALDLVHSLKLDIHDILEQGGKSTLGEEDVREYLDRRYEKLMLTFNPSSAKMRPRPPRQRPTIDMLLKSADQLQQNRRFGWSSEDEDSFVRDWETQYEEHMDDNAFGWETSQFRQQHVSTPKPRRLQQKKSLYQLSRWQQEKHRRNEDILNQYNSRNNYYIRPSSNQRGSGNTDGYRQQTRNDYNTPLSDLLLRQNSNQQPLPSSYRGSVRQMRHKLPPQQPRSLPPIKSVPLSQLISSPRSEKNSFKSSLTEPESFDLSQFQQTSQEEFRKTRHADMHYAASATANPGGSGEKKGGSQINSIGTLHDTVREPFQNLSQSDFLKPYQSKRSGSDHDEPTHWPVQ